VVTVVEGVVAVSSTTGDVDPVTVRLNQSVRYSPNGPPSAPERTDADIETAWRRGKLIFNRRPLADVVADIERYRRGKIILLGDGLRSLAVTGVFDLKNPEAILTTIEDTLPVQVTRLPFVTIVR
jgi:transmembrane sensor